MIEYIPKWIGDISSVQSNFILGCAESLLLCGLFSSCIQQGLLQLRCTGFSSWWLLLLWSTGSRVRELSRALGFRSCSIGAQWSRFRLQSTGSVIVAHRLSCSACEIFLDQGSNPCLLHRRRFFTTDHQGSPCAELFKNRNACKVQKCSSQYLGIFRQEIHTHTHTHIICIFCVTCL